MLADIKAIAAMGCYGAAAITSITFQNTLGVYGAEHASIDATGSLLRGRSPLPLVVDPVVRSTSGYDLIDDAALRALVEGLFPLADVVTPNAVEAERLTGLPVRSEREMEAAARALVALGAKAALVKGATWTSAAARSTSCSTGATCDASARRGSTRPAPTGPGARSRPQSRRASPGAGRSRTPWPKRRRTSPRRSEGRPGSGGGTARSTTSGRGPGAGGNRGRGSVRVAERSESSQFVDDGLVVQKTLLDVSTGRGGPARSLAGSIPMAL